MREIKFRAWDKTTKRMFVPVRHLYVNGKFTATDPKTSFCSELVMQYTGLHDKDGKEIYEGDIVEFTAYTKFREQSENRTEVVTYSCEPNGRVGFTPMVWHTDVEDGYYNYEIENIRIIGNIYENPELLEDK